MWLQLGKKRSSKATNAQKMAPSQDVNNDVVWNNPISPQQPGLDLYLFTTLNVSLSASALNVSLSTSAISVFASAAWFCSALLKHHVEYWQLHQSKPEKIVFLVQKNRPQPLWRRNLQTWMNHADNSILKLHTKKEGFLYVSQTVG